MKVLLAASEVHPFAKTGGLADVVGALPRALAEQGIDVAVCLPLYAKVRRRNDPLEVVAESVPCPFAGGNRPFRLLRTNLPGSADIPVLLVENAGMFESEDEIYGSEPGSYGDGHLRFLYFCRALLKVPQALEWQPDVLHLNDWQTALVAPLLRTAYKDDAELSGAAAVLTIHNLAYQGAFTREDLVHAGIPEFLLREGRLLEQGVGNLLAGGIRFADGLTTVSRTYAREILTEQFGEGLQDVLRWRREMLTGVVNGLDVETWNPADDPNLPAHYDATDLEGKARCKQALLAECGLAESPGPVLGLVARFAAQKGLALVPPVLEKVLADRPDLRFVALGSGEPGIEDAMRRLQARHPTRVHVRLAFDAALSSRIEAGSDLFLMPSRFEPCGLNQLISMRYGTPPVVRRTGGLADTVVPASPAALADGTATGFGFDRFAPEALLEAVESAVALWSDDPAAFRAMQERGMTRDWSWTRSAREYVQVYEAALARRAGGQHLEPLLHDLPAEPLEVELPPLEEVPEHYDRDVLTVVPQSPHTVFCLWELSGARLEDGALGALQLVVIDEAAGSTRSEPVEARGWRLVAGIAPGARLRVRVEARGGAAVLLEKSGIELPADIWPEHL